MEEVPEPRLKDNYVKIRTTLSLISTGTERMLVEFGKSNLLNKARQQPDKVRMVLDKIRTDGLLPTLDAVRSQMETLLPLGYCNVGVVAEVGRGVTEFSIGDRVVSNGPHAEVVCVPKNLCARVPGEVSEEQAAITVLAAIGLQGVRLAQPTIGECFVVVGLGLIGLLTVQILLAQGCRVLAVDFDSGRLELASQFGADIVNLTHSEDPISAAAKFSRGRGVDGVLIAASTKSNDPVHQAATMCRKRGRIILIGVTGLKLSRADFYEKELTFQVSCSYGPGRYDKDYEDAGNDYPVGYVRWTEQRNFEAVLDLVSTGSIKVSPLISHHYSIENVSDAYDLLLSGKSFQGVIIHYEAATDSTKIEPSPAAIQLQGIVPDSRTFTVGILGAGNYAGRTLLPAFKSPHVNFRTIVSNGSVRATQLGRKLGVSQVASDPSAVFDDPEVNLVIIATQHDSHAEYVLRALETGKHVFVEKPLCMNLDELDKIRREIEKRNVQIMVGFNRRFSPLVEKTRLLLSSATGPKAFIMTVNAGFIPADHWVHDPAIGGGRILGEGCHFIDLLRYLSGSPIAAYALAVLDGNQHSNSTRDSASITLTFEDGSIGTIHYLSNGHKRFPKERLEIFSAGRILRIDNFRELRGWGWSGFSSQRLWRQDKGQRACVSAFLEGISNGAGVPIPLGELLEVSKVSIELQQLADTAG